MLFRLSTVVRDTKFDFIFIIYFLSHVALLVALCKSLLSISSVTSPILGAKWWCRSESGVKSLGGIECAGCTLI